jgi:hypothetical protein
LTSINVDNANPNYSSDGGVLYNKNKTTLIQYPGGKQGAFSIPTSVTNIGSYAFIACSSLTSITIPTSVASIGLDAFSRCSSLRNVVVLHTTPPSINYNTFYDVPLSYAILTVPKGSKTAYQNASFWKNFGTIVEMD